MAKIISATLFRRTIQSVIEERGLLPPEKLQELVRLAEKERLPLEQLLAREKSLPEQEVYACLAEAAGLPFDDLTAWQPPESLSSQVLPVCQRELLLPLKLQEGVLLLATANPAAAGSAEGLLTAMGIRPKFVVSPPGPIKRNLDSLLAAAEEEDIAGGMSDLAVSLDISSADTEQKPVPGRQQAATPVEISGGTDAPAIIQLVNKTLMLGVKQGASDIHVETLEKGTRVRFRLDGVLTGRLELSGQAAAAFVSRILVMAGLDITERIMPQDGSFKVTNEGRTVEFRIASMPGLYGQNLTLRLLSGQERQAIDLTSMGLRSDETEIIRRTMRFPHGMMLVSGPTGSGKSTTLYAILETMANPALKIITIEDPVERRIAQVQQIQVRINRNDQERSLTFARGLRTILRLDPDIIMVGEIRDKETAEIAVQASLTGHLVLSTVHANSSIETLRRLNNIGVDFYLLMSSLNLVLAQRLVRRLCTTCRTPRDLRPDEADLFRSGRRPDQLFEAKGCKRCMGTGYLGRVGLFEFLPITDEIRDRVQEGKLSDGMGIIRQTMVRTLRQSGLLLVGEGVIDFVELERVVGPCH
ncbi:MAG TPA: GspE/PulE family protein [Candidatus Ozemobacteraceae bacterium]|nr:GspE/PulE family protein [Candidatus Ozemobacteraceae bacterium]